MSCNLYFMSNIALHHLYKYFKIKIYKGGILMLKRNDSLGVNAIQNKFTAMLKTSLHSHKVDYLKGKLKIYDKEVPLEDYAYCICVKEDFVENIIDYNSVMAAINVLAYKEQKIISSHIIKDKGLYRSR